jgi:predicted GH43/DUF377 family glycosyl hydrolase
MVKGDDELYYLYFSRWPQEEGFEAWITHSEVGYAVSDSLLGPFEYKGIALKGRGGDNWDATTIHNPTVIKIDGKYYMYYMGTKGYSHFDGPPKMSDLNWWEYRNNQRVGVAVADNPQGPWERFDKPVIDVTHGSHDHLMTSNPTVTQGHDGRIYMVYKAVGDGAMPKGGRVICGVAIADSPLGPFVKGEKPIMINPENNWSVEDPFIWYQDDRFYAIVKDFQGYFTKTGETSIALFESTDGIDWVPSEHPFAYSREIHWEDGEIQKLDLLDRPQILFENGKPAVLCCAVLPNKERDFTFNVQIPLKDKI